MGRMDRSKLNIGVYYLAPYARTEAHIRELSECGVDMVVNVQHDIRVLDLFHKYHIGAIVTGILPGWFGGDGTNAGTMSKVNTMDKYIEASGNFTDHPAIWGIDTGDEPSGKDFEHYGRVFEWVKSLFPNQFPYLNIYPSYGLNGKNSSQEIFKQLGTETYSDYIEMFCRSVKADYICFDYYLYSANLKGAYESLSVVSEACRRTGRSFWIVLQVNSHQPDKWISEQQLRYQSNMALAFGAETILWACYTAGWWHNHVLDKKGEKTQQYDKLKKVNSELHILDKEYRKYRHIATHFVGDFGEDGLSADGISLLEVLNTKIFFDVKADGGRRLLIGHMEKKTDVNNEALWICAADDPYDEHMEEYQISFRVKNENVIIFGCEGEIPFTLREDGSYVFTIHSCEGVLLTV